MKPVLVGDYSLNMTYCQLGIGYYWFSFRMIRLVSWFALVIVAMGIGYTKGLIVNIMYLNSIMESEKKRDSAGSFEEW